MIADVDGVLFDLDGVIFTGTVAVPHAAKAVTRLQSSGIPAAFVTNNASRSPDDIAAHLASFGIIVDPHTVVTSPQVAADLLVDRVPAASSVLVVGSDALRNVITAAGFSLVSSADDEPVAVVQGFAPSIGWRDLAEASAAVSGGALWVATNMDVTLPTERGLAPGNGSLVQAVANAVGRGPDLVAGKPEPALFTLAAARIEARRPLVVGDRLDTDIAGGQRAGMRTALVLTGVTKAVSPGDPQPDYVLRDLRGLFDGTRVG